MTPLSPAGTFVCPLSFCPQAVTLPSDVRATLNPEPQLMATTLLSPGGPVGPPQSATVPSSSTAKLFPGPAPTAIAGLRSAGIAICPFPLLPQPVMLPSDLSASAWNRPAATATTLLHSPGIRVSPPQARTV